MKIIQNKKPDEKRESEERSNNTNAAYTLIVAFCRYVSIKANEARYTQGRNNNYTQQINNNWFMNRKLQPLLPEAFRGLTQRKSKRRATNQANDKTTRATNIQELLETISQKLYMLVNTPVYNDDIEERYTKLKTDTTEILEKKNNQAPRL